MVEQRVWSPQKTVSPYSRLTLEGQATRWRLCRKINTVACRETDDFSGDACTFGTGQTCCWATIYCVRSYNRRNAEPSS